MNTRRNFLFALSFWTLKPGPMWMQGWGCGVHREKTDTLRGTSRYIGVSRRDGLSIYKTAAPAWRSVECVTWRKTLIKILQKIGFGGWSESCLALINLLSIAVYHNYRFRAMLMDSTLSWALAWRKSYFEKSLVSINDLLLPLTPWTALKRDELRMLTLMSTHVFRFKMIKFNKGISHHLEIHNFARIWQGPSLARQLQALFVKPLSRHAWVRWKH